MKNPFQHPSLTVELTDPGHRYYDNLGREYMSVSKFLNRFEEPFDTQGMAPRTARKRLVAAGTPINEFTLAAETEVVIAEWEGKRDGAADWGTLLHKSLQDYQETGKCPPEHLDLCERMHQFYLDKHRIFSEVVVFSEKYRIAGTIDRPMIRKNSINPIIDIDDFKTNKEKGIQFFSPYGKKFTGIMGWMEHCNYNRYALQLSIYAYLIYETFKYDIGSLNIRYIDKSLQIQTIPVNYLFYDVRRMLKWHQENPVNF